MSILSNILAFLPLDAEFLPLGQSLFLGKKANVPEHRASPKSGAYPSSNTYVSENQIPTRMKSQPVIILAHHSTFDSTLYVLPTDLAL